MFVVVDEYYVYLNVGVCSGFGCEGLVVVDVVVWEMVLKFVVKFEGFDVGV